MGRCGLRLVDRQQIRAAGRAATEEAALETLQLDQGVEGPRLLGRQSEPADAALRHDADDGHP